MEMYNSKRLMEDGELELMVSMLNMFMILLKLLMEVILWLVGLHLMELVIETFGFSNLIRREMCSGKEPSEAHFLIGHITLGKLPMVGIL